MNTNQLMVDYTMNLTRDRHFVPSPRLRQGHMKGSILMNHDNLANDGFAKPSNHILLRMFYI